ncbi:MAG: NHL repeat-containing protein, partial [Deltaproteobacteria bacterium]|nr:NHL repeat-containing protein [Deltaproteobacteria bacterium]
MTTSFKNLSSYVLFIAVFSFILSFSSYASAAVCGPPLWDYKYTGELARLSGPSKIEVDYSGQLYVADFNGNAIRIYNAKGEEINVVPVNNPRGVAVDQSGQLYVAQTTFVSVITLDDKGQIAGSRTLGDKKFAFANDVAVDQVTGRIFVVDSIYKRVFVFGSDNSYITHFANDVYGTKEWVAIDIDQANGRIYVASQGNNRVNIYRLDDYTAVKGILRPFGRSSDSEFAMLQGVSVDSSGRSFVVDGGLDTIYFFDGCYTYITSLGSHGYSSGLFNLPLDVAADSYGRIFVSNIDGRVSIFRSAEMVAPVPDSPVGNV